MIVVEYSLSQRAFHKLSLEEMVVKNITNALKGVQTDYIPIGIFEKEKTADGFIEGLRPALQA